MAVTPHFHNHFHNTLQFSEFFIPIGWIPFSRLVPLVPLYLYTWKNYYSHKKQSIYINLFILFFYFSFNLFILICYLAAPQPTLYHCRGGSLINLILIIEFDTYLTWKSLLASYWGWVQKPSWAPGGLLTEIPLILNVGL